MTRASPSLRPATNADAPAVRELVFGVLREYGLAPDPDCTDSDLADIEAAYHRRGGRFGVLVDEAAGQVLGSVGLYPVDEQTVELRKMYLRRNARGRGLGRRMLEHALAEARRMGFARVTLETASVLTEAIALYRRYGFTPFDAPHCSRRCDQTYVLALALPNCTTTHGPQELIEPHQSIRRTSGNGTAIRRKMGKKLLTASLVGGYAARVRSIAHVEPTERRDTSRRSKRILTMSRAPQRAVRDRAVLDSRAGG